MYDESRWGFVENDCELPSSVVGKANSKAIKAVHPGNGTRCIEKYKKNNSVSREEILDITTDMWSDMNL